MINIRKVTYNWLIPWVDYLAARYHRDIGCEMPFWLHSVLYKTAIFLRKRYSVTMSFRL